MGQRIDVSGDLNRQRASRSDAREKLRVDGRVVFYPLEGGVGEDYIELAIVRPIIGRGPLGDVTGDPGFAGMLAAGALDHLGGTVQPCEFGIRPAVAEDRRAIAGSASQVNHTARVGYGDARGQIAAGLGALCREFQILVRVPAGHLPTVAPLADARGSEH